jgi:hypothetical protein
VSELEQAIAALDPAGADPAALARAEALARALAAHPTCGALAATIARTLAGWARGEVEPHHAQWRLASAALTLSQEMARPGGPAEVALAGARHDLDTLFPRLPDSPVPPTADDLDLVPPSALVRKPD